MENIKLSFIVPVYNVAPYLRKCVFSLVHQDFRGYEIILVDDGSTDGSSAICDELSEMISDERLVIRVIHQENGGLSAARNAGLKEAKGEYVCFVDSDDYWEENVLGGMMAQVERDKLDVLRFKYRYVNEKYEEYIPYKNNPYLNNDYSEDVTDGPSFLNVKFGTNCYSVMFIMKRKFVPCFTEGIHFEDIEWLPRMILRTTRLASTNKVVYNYLLRQGSITQVHRNREKISKNLDDRLTSVGQYRKYIEQYPNCPWLKNMQSSLASGILATVAQSFYSEKKYYIAQLQDMNVFPLSIANQSRTYARRAHLINILGPHVYCALMRLVRV